MINVIKANYKQHGEDIVNLLSAYAQDPMGGGEDLTDFTKANLVNSLDKLPHAFSVIAYSKDTPVGLINCFEAFSTFSCKPLVNIHDVVVLKEYRGQNISQLMLKKVEKIAKHKNCCKLTLKVLTKNPIAQASYEKFGFGSYCLDPEHGSAMFWQKEL